LAARSAERPDDTEIARGAGKRSPGSDASSDAARDVVEKRRRRSVVIFWIVFMPGTDIALPARFRVARPVPSAITFPE
jgi:hypothetical protein